MCVVNELLRGQPGLLCRATGVAGGFYRAGCAANIGAWICCVSCSQGKNFNCRGDKRVCHSLPTFLPPTHLKEINRLAQKSQQTWNEVLLTASHKWNAKHLPQAHFTRNIVKIDETESNLIKMLSLDSIFSNSDAAVRAAYEARALWST